MSQLKKHLRAAVINAVSVEVCCPHCGAPQPSPDNGSEMWLPSQVKAVAAVAPQHVCVSCDEPFTVEAHTRVAVIYESAS